MDAGRTAGWSDDLWGGLAAMLVALPSSLAFGVVVYSSLGPGHAAEGALAGILGAAALGIVAPLVSRNGGFITAPCAPAAAVMGGLAAELTATGVPIERIHVLMALTALVAAGLQMLFGVLRAGRLIKFIPYQVVSGYLSGVAVIIALGQLPRLLGLPGGVGLAEGLASPSLWRWPGVVVGLVTMATMLVAPRFVKAVPAAILGLLAGVATYLALGLVSRDLLVSTHSLLIGPIQAAGSPVQAAAARFSVLVAFRPSDVGLVLVSAATLAVLLSIDTLKTGVVLDALLRRRHDSNRELLGQGVANFASFLSGGMPGAGTMGPTLVNVTSGGRTARAGIVEGALVVAVLVALGPLIAWVPIGALAGILLIISWRMFDWHMFGLLARPGTRLDFVVIAAVIVVAETVGLIQASAVGVGLAILLFIRDQIQGSVILRRHDLREVASKRRRVEEARAILDRDGALGVVVNLQGNIFFGTADQLFSELEADLNRARYVLLDLRRVQSMDYTAGHLFQQMRQRLEERSGALLFSGMPSGLLGGRDIRGYLVELGLVGSQGGIEVFPTRDAALEWMEDKLLEAGGYEHPADRAPIGLEEFHLLAGLGAEAIAAIAGIVREASFAPGERVFSQGDAGDELILVRKGRIQVLLPLEGGIRHHLATFCRDDFFGEMAFLDREKRSAHAEAAVATEVYLLGRARFDELAARDAATGSRLLESLARALCLRLRTADAELGALAER